MEYWTGGQLLIDDRFLGYRAWWAVGKAPVAINAHLEKITNRYWTLLVRTERAIVPAAGWYEWNGEKAGSHPATST